MESLGLQGAIRGKPVRTECHAGILDFTYQRAGFVYVAFVIDAYARRIVGWRVSEIAHASFVLDGIVSAMALFLRRSIAFAYSSETSRSRTRCRACRSS